MLNPWSACVRRVSFFRGAKKRAKSTPYVTHYIKKPMLMKSLKQVSSKSLISYHRRWRNSKGLHFTDPILSARHILCNDGLQHSLRMRRNWKNFNTTLFSKTLSQQHLVPRRAELTPRYVHFDTNFCIVAMCGDTTAVNWAGYPVTVYVCIHVMGCGAGEHNWRRPAHSLHLLMSNLILSFVPP
jgi:hypothetical protein